jgi:hypothetical protein
MSGALLEKFNPTEIRSVHQHTKILPFEEVQEEADFALKIFKIELKEKYPKISSIHSNQMKSSFMKLISSVFLFNVKILKEVGIDQARIKASNLEITDYILPMIFPTQYQVLRISHLMKTKPQITLLVINSLKESFDDTTYSNLVNSTLSFLVYFYHHKYPQKPFLSRKKSLAFLVKHSI